MLKIIVWNSAPRTGKGKAAKHMTNLINTSEGNLVGYHREFKDELIKVAANILGMSPETFLKGYDEKTSDFIKNLPPIHTYPEWYKDYKGTIHQRIRSKQYSKREFLQHVSENVVKKSFGEDAFGKAFVNNLPSEGLVFVSDSGFAAELQPVITHVGAENVLVIRIHREGCTFEGDTRNYLTEDMFEDNIQFIDIENNGTLEEFYKLNEEVICEWLK